MPLRPPQHLHHRHHKVHHKAFPRHLHLREDHQVPLPPRRRHSHNTARTTRTYITHHSLHNHLLDANRIMTVLRHPRHHLTHHRLFQPVPPHQDRRDDKALSSRPHHYNLPVQHMMPDRVFHLRQVRHSTELTRPGHQLGRVLEAMRVRRKTFTGRVLHIRA